MLRGDFRSMEQVRCVVRGSQSASPCSRPAGRQRSARLASGQLPAATTRTLSSPRRLEHSCSTGPVYAAGTMMVQSTVGSRTSSKLRSRGKSRGDSRSSVRPPDSCSWYGTIGVVVSTCKEFIIQSACQRIAQDTLPAVCTSGGVLPYRTCIMLACASRKCMGSMHMRGPGGCSVWVCRRECEIWYCMLLGD